MLASLPAWMMVGQVHSLVKGMRKRKKLPLEGRSIVCWETDLTLFVGHQG